MDQETLASRVCKDLLDNQDPLEIQDPLEWLVSFDPILTNVVDSLKELVWTCLWQRCLAATRHALCERS